MLLLTEIMIPKLQNNESIIAKKHTDNKPKLLVIYYLKIKQQTNIILAQIYN